MTILYVSTAANKLASVEVDENGDLVKMLQIVDPVVQDVPSNVPDKLPGGMPSIATEWISRHPKDPILYALTSFWNKAHAIVTTFKIEENGILTYLGAGTTGGHQAAHAAFSPDGSTYVVAHHNGGKLCFFDVSKPNIPLQKPIIIMDPPEVVPGTRKVPQPDDMDVGLPSLHGVCYIPNGKFLIVSDPVQNAVFTYAVDKKGRPTSPQHKITSQLICGTAKTPYGWLVSLIVWWFGAGPRPRRAVVHPNGQYLYVVHEITNYIQVYAINDKGQIDPACLQEISCINNDLRKGWIGIAMTSSSELVATDYALIVSVRGMGKWGGRCERSVRLFHYKDDGRMLVDAGTVKGIPAAVRHFYLSKDASTMWVGMNSSTVPLVQKYVFRREGNDIYPDGEYQLTGQANVGMDVMCVTPKDI